MSISEKVDQFLKRKFIGENKSEKIENSGKKGEAPLFKKRFHNIGTPEKVGILEIGQQELYRELYDQIQGLKKRVESLELENENYKDRKAEIIPAIIAKDFDELREKIKKAENFVDWIQVDIMDGKFVPNITWNNPAELKVESKKLKVNLEAHLMIEKPWDYVEKWAESGVKRIIVHYESFIGNFDKMDNVLGIIKKSGIETAIAINPKTPWESIKKWINELDMVLMMTVEPGFGGQVFTENILNKIRDFKKNFPEKMVGVDGGINLATAAMAVGAGADILATGNFIYQYPEGAEKAVGAIKKSISDF